MLTVLEQDQNAFDLNFRPHRGWLRQQDRQQPYQNESLHQVVEVARNYVSPRDSQSLDDHRE